MAEFRKDTSMPTNNYYHIFCTSGERVIYEGRFQCYSRRAALNLLREKIGRRNLSGLTFSITEIPIDIIREVVEAIIHKKPMPEGDIVLPDKNTLIPSSGYASIVSNKRNPKAPRNLGETKRRLGDL